MVSGLEKEQVGSGDTCSRYRAATFTPFVVTKQSGNLRDCTNYVSPKIMSLEEMSLNAWPQFHFSFWKSVEYNRDQEPHNIISWQECHYIWVILEESATSSEGLEHLFMCMAYLCSIRTEWHKFSVVIVVHLSPLSWSIGVRWVYFQSVSAFLVGECIWQCWQARHECIIASVFVGDTGCWCILSVF